MPGWSVPLYMNTLQTCALISHHGCSGQIRFLNTLFFFFFLQGWVSPESETFSRCSTRGCFNYTYLHRRKHDLCCLCGLHTHTPSSCFFLNHLWHGHAIWFLIPSTPSTHDQMTFPKIPPLPGSCQNPRVWEMEIYWMEPLSGRKGGSRVQFLVLLFFSGGDF